MFNEVEYYTRLKAWEYAEILKAAYDVITAEDPEAKLIMASLVKDEDQSLPWLEELCDHVRDSGWGP